MKKTQFEMDFSMLISKEMKFKKTYKNLLFRFFFLT